MSDPIAERYGERNPRTAEEPMAFTFGEFVRGAIGAWGWFLLFSAPVLLIYVAVADALSGAPTGSMSLVVALYGWFIVVFPASLAALLLGAPGA